MVSPWHLDAALEAEGPTTGFAPLLGVWAGGAELLQLLHDTGTKFMRWAASKPLPKQVRSGLNCLSDHLMHQGLETFRSGTKSQAPLSS